MNPPSQSFTEALMHARNCLYTLRHSVGANQPIIVSFNTGVMEEYLNEIERAHQAELAKAGGQPAHPPAIAPDADSPEEWTWPRVTVCWCCGEEKLCRDSDLGPVCSDSCAERLFAPPDEN